MSITFYNTDQLLGKIETHLNTISWTPVFHYIGAPLRMIVGKVELAAGIVFAALNLLKGICTLNRSAFRNMVRCLEYSIHGLANLLRAGIEVLPLSFALTLTYDATVGRMNYRQEQLGRGIYPWFNQPYYIAAN